MKVWIDANTPFDLSVGQPLGRDRAPHRIWTWEDGSWVVVRFVSDGLPIAVASAGLAVTVYESNGKVRVRVRPSEARASTADDALSPSPSDASVEASPGASDDDGRE